MTVSAPVTEPRPERTVRLAGASNVRDLGGLTTGDGQHTRFGVLYRSDSPYKLTPDDIRELVTERGLRTQLDLRATIEAERTGVGPLEEAGVNRISTPLTRNTGAGLPQELAVGNMAGHYLTYLTGARDEIVTGVRAIIDPERQPALVHCAAGKDRTGVLLALLLDAIGVNRDEIIADYALTDANMAAVAENALKATLDHQRIQLPPEALRAVPETMTEFLEQLTTIYGGGRSFLVTHGVPEADLDRFAEAFLEK